jgi:hypothetical protein
MGTQMRDALTHTSNSTASAAPNPGWLPRLFQPPAHSHALPGARLCKIALRTVHLMVTSVLVGGHAFGAPARSLIPWLCVAIATGVGMVFYEAYPSLSFLFEGWGLMLLAKLALLCVVPFTGRLRLPILLAVVALASIASHMPRRLRHYSLLHRKTTR